MATQGAIASEPKPWDTLHGIASWFDDKIEANRRQYAQDFPSCRKNMPNKICETCDWTVHHQLETTAWTTLLGVEVLEWVHRGNIPQSVFTKDRCQKLVEEEWRSAVLHFDRDMAMCHNAFLSGVGPAALVDPKGALMIKQKWDTECRRARRHHEVAVARHRITCDEEWSRWADIMIFDSTPKIKEWETEGWFDARISKLGFVLELY